MKRVAPLLYKAYKSERTTLKKLIKKIESLKKEGDIIIEPKSRMAMLDNDPKTVRANIKQGYEDAKNNKKLTKFIKKLKKSRPELFR